MRVHLPAPLAVTLLAATLAAACSREERASTGDGRAARAASAPPAPPPAPDAVQLSSAGRDAAEEAVVANQAAPTADFAGRGIAGGAGAAAEPSLTSVAISGAQGAGDSVAPSMIIRTGQVTVEVDSLDAAVARVRQVAARLGGYVANTSQSGGDGQVRAATLELKVPAARFDEAVTALRPIGDVETVNVQAQDVGEEFVDVSARVANARRLEERMVDLLARRTGRLQDVLAVERELARVREQIERYEGRLRYLRTRTAVSTLAVTVHEPPPILVREPGVNPIGEAFREAWRLFVRLTAAVIASLGVVIPVGVVAALAWATWRRSRTRGTRPAVEAVKPAV